ncbi:MAG: hypothetical protein OXG25_00615 [Gammaproteobacteria bacterium]|nr:hypothetical protein [Gammaproteobacteria bacterium]
MTTEHQPHPGEPLSEVSLASSVDPQPVSWFDHILKKLSGKRIYLDGNPYLTRYYLIGDGSGRRSELYLHYIQLKDPYRWLHNHPWRWFLSIVVRGHYTQEVLRPSASTRRRRMRVRFVNLFLGRDRYHAIHDVPKKGVWTLVLVPPKSNDTERWGYWNEDEDVHEPDTGDDSVNCQTVRFGAKQTFN